MALKKCTLTTIWVVACILWALVRFLPSMLSVVDVTTMACLYSSRQQAFNQTFAADLEAYTFRSSVVDLLVASILRGGLINFMYWACCQSPFWFSPQKVFIGTATITGLSTILIVTKLCLFHFSMQADVIETTYARLMFALSLVFAFAECLAIFAETNAELRKRKSHFDEQLNSFVIYDGMQDSSLVDSSFVDGNKNPYSIGRMNRHSFHLPLGQQGPPLGQAPLSKRNAQAKGERLGNPLLGGTSSEPVDSLPGQTNRFQQKPRQLLFDGLSSGGNSSKALNKQGSGAARDAISTADGSDTVAAFADADSKFIHLDGMRVHYKVSTACSSADFASSFSVFGS